ncbi:MAG: rhodanese-like domain-containing protein [Pirellulaceae bacterium]
MSLILETVQTEGIAELSYLIGDDGPGVAAVIDPRPDVEIYLELARRRNVSITHIFETHIHADLVSGARELAERVGNAKIYVSVEGGAKYDFEHEGIRDGATFEFGDLVLTARHTPGHTPEHMSYLAGEKKRAPKIWGVFTGDSLFVNSAGRPDLMGADQAEALADQLYDTLRNFYLTLDDDVIIYPSHGHGSPCGAEIGDRLSSTIGYERQFNPFLQHPDRAEFKEFTLSSAPPEPTYYKRMKRLNAEGPVVIGNLPLVPGLPPKAFLEAIGKEGAVVVDTRSMLAFAGGHIQGALNIGGSPELSIWAGWMLDPKKPLLLVLEHDNDVAKTVPLFVRTGYTKFAGYLVGGMKAWDNAGFPLHEACPMTVHEVKEQADELQILDVRSPEEWNEGHIPGAKHIFLPDVPGKLGEVRKDKPIAVYCNSGYRASLATSILKTAGLDAHTVPGSWQAWVNAGYPVQT